MRRWIGFGLGLAPLVAVPALVSAHGVAPIPPSDVFGLLVQWSFDPLIQVPLIATALAFISAVRRVNAAHPANPVPGRRVAAFLLGLAAIEVSLQSPIEHYDTTLFSVHMVQHILLTLVAPPLIAAAAPVTLLLRFAKPDARRRWIVPILHSRPLKVVTFPVVTWLFFAGVMWGTHFSPVFNESLENPFVHDLEHVAYLWAGLLFWWPVIAVD